MFVDLEMLSPKVTHASWYVQTLPRLAHILHRKMDRLSKSDPFVVIKWKTDTEENWREIGEVLTDFLAGNWLRFVISRSEVNS